MNIQRLNCPKNTLYSFLLLGFISCSSHKNNDSPAPHSPQPVKENFETEAETLETPKGTPKRTSSYKPLWVGDLRSLRLIKVDSQLNAEKTFDLSSYYPQGGAGITAMSFLDPVHMAILLDPQLGLNGPIGGGGQIVSLVNKHSGKVAVRDFAIGSIFQFDSSPAVLANPAGMPATFLIQTALGIERYLFTNRPDGARLDERVLGETGSAYIPNQTGGPCPVDVVTGMASLTSNESTALLILSGGLGMNRRLTIVGSLGKAASPRCLSSYNLANDEFITPTDVPVAAEQLSDGKVYVVFQGPTSKIVRYDFDGNQLSQATEVNRDSGVIGLNPRSLVGFGTQGFVVATGRKLVSFTLDGEPRGHLTLSNIGEVGAIAREPQGAPASAPTKAPSTRGSH